MMVQAVRRGESARSVARCFAVSPATVLKWVSRCEGRRLDRVDFADRPRGAKVVWNRTAAAAERRVLELRQRLRNGSIGFVAPGGTHSLVLVVNVRRGIEHFF